MDKFTLPHIKQEYNNMLATGSNQPLNRSANASNGSTNDSRRGGRKKHSNRSIPASQNHTRGKSSQTLSNFSGKNPSEAMSQQYNHNNHLPKARHTNKKTYEKGNRKPKPQAFDRGPGQQPLQFTSVSRNTLMVGEVSAQSNSSVISDTGWLFDDPANLGFMKSNNSRNSRVTPRYMLSQPRLLVTPPFQPDPWDQQNQAKMMQMEAANNGTDYQGIYEEFQKMREIERKKMEELGLVDAENTRKDLNDAIYFQGSCLEMCPVFERTRRALENNVKALEKDPITNKISRERAVKAFSRPAAGQPPPMPSDVRPPHILVKTLDYIVDNFLDQLPGAHSFIWDRTRSIRQDFIYQNFYGAEAIDCNERIVRIHLVSLHIMAGNDVEYSQQQELEQFNKALQTLTEIYEDVRHNGGQCPNEAEFRAYHLISHFRDPELEREIQSLPNHILRDQKVQLALRFRYLMAQKHLVERGYTNIIGPMDLFVEFFRLVYRDETFFLLACLLETHFNEVRFYALKSISRSYHTKGKPMIAASLQQMLGFDTIDQLIAFVSYYDVDTINDNGTILVDLFNKEKLESKYKLNSLNDKPKLSQAFSAQLNAKMGTPLKELVNSGKANQLQLQDLNINTILHHMTKFPAQRMPSVPPLGKSGGQNGQDKIVTHNQSSAFGVPLSASTGTGFGQPPSIISEYAPFDNSLVQQNVFGQPPGQQPQQDQKSVFSQTFNQASNLSNFSNATSTFGGTQNSGQLPNFGEASGRENSQESTTQLGKKITHYSIDVKLNGEISANISEPFQNTGSTGFGNSFHLSQSKETASDGAVDNIVKKKEKISKPNLSLSKTGGIGENTGSIIDESSLPGYGHPNISNGSQEKEQRGDSNKMLLSTNQRITLQSFNQNSFSSNRIEETPGTIGNAPGSTTNTLQTQRLAFSNSALSQATDLIYNQILKSVIDRELSRLLPRLIKFQNRSNERFEIIEALTVEMYSAFVSELTYQSTMTILADDFSKRTTEKKHFSNWKRSLKKMRDIEKAKRLKLQELDSMEFRKPTLKRINSELTSSQPLAKRQHAPVPHAASLDYIIEKQKDIHRLWEPLNLTKFVENCGSGKNLEYVKNEIEVKCLLIVEDWKSPYSKWLNTKFSLGLSDDRSHYFKRVRTERIRVSFESLPKNPHLQDSSINNTAFVIFECGMIAPDQSSYSTTEEKLVRDSNTLQKIVAICNRYCLYKVQFLILYWDNNNSNLPMKKVEEILGLRQNKQPGEAVESMRVLDMSRRDRNVAETLAVGVEQMGVDFDALLTVRGRRREARAEALKQDETIKAETVAVQPEVSRIACESVQQKEADMLRKGRELRKRKYLANHIVTGHDGHIDLSNTTTTFRTPNASFANNSIVNLNNSFFGNNSTFLQRDNTVLGTFGNGSILEESTPFGSPGPQFARPSLPKKVQELKDLSAAIRARYKK